MNKKTGFYFKKGWSEAGFCYRKLNFKQKLAVLMYLIVSFVGKILFFTRPVFAMADQNLAKMISETRDFEISQAFHGVGEPKRYLSLLGAYFYKDMTLAAVVTIGFIPYWCYHNDLVINPNEVMDLVLLIVACVIAGIALLVSNMKYAGAGYVGANLADPETNDILYLSRVQMKKNRGKIFRALLRQFFICVPISGGAFFGIVFLNTLDDMFYWPLIGIGILLVLILLNVGIFNKAGIATLTVEYEVYKDAIPLKKTIVIKEVAGDSESYISLFKNDEKDLQVFTIEQMKKKEGK